MKATKVNLDHERQLMINLITSTDFCKSIVPMLQPKYLKTKYAKTVALWIKEYYDAYGEAPHALIKEIYHERKAHIFDEEEAESISDFLASLSDEHDKSEHFNVEYAVEQSIKYLKLRSLELLKDAITKAIVEGEPVNGEALVANYSKIGKPEGDSVDILHDPSQIIDAFTQDDEILFTLPGALRITAGPFMRGDLSAWIGKPKGKKSFALMFSAEYALTAGCRVVFFSLEMRRKQLVRRMWQSVTGELVTPGIVQIPKFELVSKAMGENEIWGVTTNRIEKQGIDLEKISIQQNQLLKRFKGGDIRFITLPAYSASVDDLVAHLDNLAWYEDFVPDLVIVDYADIVKPSKSAGTEYRHQLDSIWKGLRALAQARNIHVMTASQTNRAGLKGDIELENIAEDMRKLTHVSLLLALNQTPKEKEMHLMRVKTLLNRDDSSNGAEEATVLQQLSLGRFYLDSRLTKNVEKLDDVD